MSAEHLTRHEVFRALQIIESLARIEAQRISSENSKRERQQRSDSYNDDPGEMLFAMMNGGRSDGGLGILADDVASMKRSLDFRDPELLSDIRQLAERFMQVAKNANDSLEDVNSPQAFAWQRSFKLLRKVANFCRRDCLSDEPESKSHQGDDGIEVISLGGFGEISVADLLMQAHSPKRKSKKQKKKKKERKKGK